ncbi:MAG: hypothetical protein H0V83_12635 [Rubrobacter sp.]|nr:hypothetical protein [Rubrobacter sp.]
MPMFGSVAASGSEPLLPLAALSGTENGSAGGEEIEAVIDTGCNDSGTGLSVCWPRGRNAGRR